MSFAPSITAKPGRQFILQVARDTSPTTFVTVGGIRTTGMTINNNPVDITNVASEGFRELLPDGGVQSFSFQCDGIFDSDTDGADIMFEAARTRVLIEAKVISGHGDAFLGNLVVQSFSRNGSYDNAEMFTAQLESSGRIEYEAAP